MIYFHRFSLLLLKKFLFLFFFLFALNLYAQEAPSEESSLSTCQKLLAHQKKETEYLKSISEIISQLKSGQTSLENYEKIRSLWMDLTGLVYTIGSFNESEFKKDPESKQYKQSDLKCIQQLEKNEKRIKTKVYKTFIMASRQRMREIAFQRTLAETPIFNWTDRYFKDNVQEVKVIPLRWIGIFSSQWDRFQTDLEMGVEGWIKVSKDLLLLFVFIFSLIGFLFISLRFNSIFAKYQEKILKNLYSSEKSAKWGLRIQKSIPYLPWALLILFIQIEQKLITDTYFSDLSIFFPYVKYYAWYKLFHTFVSQVLINFLSFTKGYELSLLKEKVDNSAKRLSSFVIWSLVLLHTAENAVGKGFVYIWIDKIYFLGLILLFITESRKWEKEIENMLEGALPDRFSSPIIRFSNKLLFLRSIILLILSIFCYFTVLLFNWLQTLEISKTLSARVFRERVKNVNKNKTSETQGNVLEYEKLFNSIQPFIENKNQAEIIFNINAYLKQKIAGNSVRKNIGLIGDTGLGKTTLIRSIKESLKDPVSCEIFSAPAREQSEAFFNEIKIKTQNVTKESVFIIDNFHYLFLSKVGGFEQIKDFFNHIDRSSDLISWVIVINKNSWIYLDAILNKTHYFNTFHYLDKWTEKEVKELILSKHQISGHKLSFENILLAMKSDNFYEDKKYVEEKYFRILWEESLGNPEVAQKMWIDSLKHSKNEKELNVGIPHSRFDIVKGLPNDFYFVLASIVRHVEISLADLAKANDVDEDFIRNAVEFCVDLGYIVHTGKTVRIAPLWQNNIFTTLVGKNYIYGR